MITPLDMIAPAGWPCSRDAALIGLLYKRDSALLEDSPRARSEAERLTVALDRELAERSRALAANGPSSAHCPDRLVLFITQACQLDCTYCTMVKYASSMSKKTLHRAVDLAMASRRRPVCLHFLGGEPLLRFDLVREAVERAEAIRPRRADEIRYLLTTNGQALKPEMIAFFKRHGFRVEFSIDGDRATFRSQRPGTRGQDHFDQVQDNLAALARAGVDYFCTAVVTPATVADLQRNLRYLAALGHRRLSVNYQLGASWPEAAAGRLLVELRRCAQDSRGAAGYALIARRREPSILTSELIVGTEGELYKNTGMFFEEEAGRHRKDLMLLPVEQAKALDQYPSTPFDNFFLLSSIYGRRKPRFREAILSNIRLGYAVDRFLRRLSAVGQAT